MTTSGFGAGPQNIAAVIGDVIDSRSHADRGALQDALSEALAAANARTTPLQPFQMTIGDEFQGVYRSVEEATHATFLVQLHLVGLTRVRFGIGVGIITLETDRAPFGQDGPAWWSARSAIDTVRAAERRYGEPPRWTTAIETSDEDRLGPLRAYLQLRDHIMGEIDRVDADILAGLLQGDNQSEIAKKLEIDKGAISRRVSGHGLSALMRALREVQA
jgi:hypothetical protein